MKFEKFNMEVREVRELSPVFDSRKSFYGKAIVVLDADRNTHLFSYGVEICRFVNGKFEKVWNGYSATTMRHINEFRRQLAKEKLTKKQWENFKNEI